MPRDYSQTKPAVIMNFTFVLRQQHDQVLLDHRAQGREPLAHTRAPDTNAIFVVVLCFVQRSLYEAAVETEKAVVLPIERCAGVRAAVAIGVNAIAPTDHE